MCVGIPMTVRAVRGVMAECEAERSEGQPACRELVDITLVPDARPGDELLVFLGLARSRLDAEEASRIRAALGALAALAGPGPDAARVQDVVARGFADLCDAPPRLPPHLEAALAAGLEEA
ncbi:HypC/HybG/HupF family hydrogenase formation chaperone [Gluconacetobacter aggeris]|uniref:HypC/HybG/HupF family hydrogenase formation chaperone n=2 Tax=Gluconacetobacter aggeris TaxID=1286186 RepID=A0A7W4NYV9_9PROT|nr:HypC/HybG/HupF family hydrogenase formation chaperone [Gluconacetobacter aggeris]MBB2168015.1 HypC/HybG/HupF family hydrogenase formation chaperone [Gluconacetobacter aggeris]